MGPVTDEAIWEFAQAVQRLPGMPKGAKINVSYGRRYARIYKEWGGQSMCWGWVDKTNGDILRGGWKKPDTRVPPRGKITDPGIMKTMCWTGPPYMQQIAGSKAKT